MAKALTEFHGLLLVELPECPIPTVDFNLLEVAIEFCSVTSAWSVNLDAIDLVAGQSAYTLVSPQPSSDFDRVTKLQVNGDVVWSLTGDKAYQLNEPPFSLDVDLQTITLNDAPTASVTGGLVIQASLVPSLDAETLPDFLYTQQRQAMKSGVLSRLMAMPGVPWTNPALSAFYQSKYQQATSFCANAVKTGNARAILRVKRSPL